MSRAEQLREEIDAKILQIPDSMNRRCAFVHLYGVSALCVLLAEKRNLNSELALIAGMLHDLYGYLTFSKESEWKNHAIPCADFAKQYLRQQGGFKQQEIAAIYSAIYHHSAKGEIHTAFDELLKDADAFQHDLYDPCSKLSELHAKRVKKVREELGIST